MDAATLRATPARHVSVRDDKCFELAEGSADRERLGAVAARAMARTWLRLGASGPDADAKSPAPCGESAHRLTLGKVAVHDLRVAEVCYVAVDAELPASPGNAGRRFVASDGAADVRSDDEGAVPCAGKTAVFDPVHASLSMVSPGACGLVCGGGRGLHCRGSGDGSEQTAWPAASDAESSAGASDHLFTDVDSADESMSEVDRMETQTRLKRWQCDLCYTMCFSSDSKWEVSDDHCKHSFCLRCIRGCIQWGLRCPFDGTPFSQIMVCGALGDRAYIAHEKAAEARRTGGLACNVDTCPGVIPSEELPTEDDPRPVMCAKCEAQMCGRAVCAVPWTPGHRCWDLLETEALVEIEHLAGMSSVPRVRPCPGRGCGVMVEHIGGCNMMHHRRCGTTWCFLCRRVGTCTHYKCVASPAPETVKQVPLRPEARHESARCQARRVAREAEDPRAERRCAGQLAEQHRSMADRLFGTRLRRVSHGLAASYQEGRPSGMAESWAEGECMRTAAHQLKARFLITLRSFAASCSAAASSPCASAGGFRV